jgi:putative tricarboxylic transport membrane protein
MIGGMDAFMIALMQLIQPFNIILLMAGICFGIIIGILPGLGPPIAITICLPFTFKLNVVQAFTLLLGLYSASIYGGSISAITLGIPGTGAAAATIADGYSMFKKGRGGEALGYALVASVIGGIFSTVCLAVITPVLASFAMKFGPREYFAIGVFGMLVVVRVAGRSMAKGLIMGGIGVFLTTFGVDEINGNMRYTFGSYNLYDGLPMVPILVGLFAISESLFNCEKLIAPKFDEKSLVSKLPSLIIMNRLKKLLLQSSVIGTIIGIVPGEGAAIGAFFSYSEARRKSKNPDDFGTGIPEGVVAAETANNATIGGALIPTLTLGVPGSAAAAVLLGAFMIQGLNPGPKLFENAPEVMYSIFIGLFMINILMLFVGQLTIRFAAKIIVIPMRLVVPTVLLLCFVGAFCVQNDIFGVWVLLWVGVFGYVIRKLGFPIVPCCIGFVLGPMIETSLRQSIVISDGSVVKFFSSPIAGTIYLLLIMSFTWKYMVGWIKSRKSTGNERSSLG